MEQEQPLVTVYIPCRNYGHFLNQAAESVINQVYKNWELIIIDEGSKDDTSNIAEKILKRKPEQITFVKNQKPKGLQKLANEVLSIANGKYMMRLDADDWLDESALFLLVNRLEASKNAGLVYGNYYYTDTDGKILDVEFRQRIGDEDLAGQLPPHGACTLFRTRALKNAGGYSEDVNAQDGWDLWYKLADRIGATNIQVPIFYYRQHGESMSRDSKRLLQARSKIFEQISSKLEGDYKPTTLAVIPVKESYPDFEGVPYKEINGRSILEIAIKNASQSNKISSVIVSSESQKVLDFSKKLEKDGKVPAHIRLLRDKDAKSQGVPIRDFMFIAGEKYSEINKSFPDIIIFLSLHAINRNHEHIDNALNVLRITESDSVVSVQEEREPMFNYGGNGLEIINRGRFQDLTFDKERLYRFNGSIIATWWEVLKADTLFGEKIAHIEMSNLDSLQIKTSAMLEYFNNLKS
jgi:glycosyltransferase involved in cell wall biosynthesis